MNICFLKDLHITLYFCDCNFRKKDRKYLKAFDALFQHIVDPSNNPDLAIYLYANFDVIKERILARW
ncbi:Deoxyguanosine kinase, partial [Mycoplasmopsis edwardii]